MKPIRIFIGGDIHCGDKAGLTPPSRIGESPIASHLLYYNYYNNRMFVCGCGVSMDRDLHATHNMLWFYKNNIGMERTNYKRVEMKALVDSALECSNHNYGESSNQQSKKHEAYSL